MKVLIVVDYQNDFVNGALGFPGAENIDEGIAAKIEEYKKNGWVVICTFDTHGKDYLNTYEGKHLPVPHCITGTEGHKLYGKTLKAAEDYATVIFKNTFPSAQLLYMLQELNEEDEITEVELVGLVTNMCVISNAVIAKAAVPNAAIKVHEGLCDSFDKEMHNAALAVMKSMQMEIV